LTSFSTEKGGEERMQKIVVLVMAAFLLVTPVLATTAGAKDLGAAAVLSGYMPGAGEWYNNDFKGSFPWGECILGYCCFLVRFASVADAASGKTNADMRLDFWTAPPGK
jgi:hypothetical protein